MAWQPWDSKGGPHRRLDELLESADLSNVAVAKRLGCHNSLVSRFRKGQIVPNADQLGQMVEMAGGSADYVLGIRPDVPPELTRDVLDLAERLVAAAGSRQPSGGRDKP